MSSRLIPLAIVALLAVSLFGAVPVHAAPAFATISPPSGTSHGGTNVTLTGTGFVEGLIVKFGTKPATAIATTGTTITATTPSNQAGAVDVTIINPDGAQTIVSQGFTFTANPAPTITAVSPSLGSALGNDRITLTGTGFSSGILPKVQFGTVQAVVVSAEAGKLVVIAPGQAPATVNLKVTNPDNQEATRTNAFTYISALAPTLTGIVPITGSTNGGTVITLTGTNLAAGLRAEFIDNAGTPNVAPAASAIFVSPTQIILSTPAITDGTPATLGSAAPNQLMDIRITNPDGQQVTLADSFTFINPASATPPTTLAVTSVTATGGPTTGGTPVTITGAGFAAGRALDVKFGGNSATQIQFINANQIKAVSPAGTAGSVSVSVVNPDGNSAALANAFTYRAQVAISSLSVTGGPTSTSVFSTGVGVVTLTGVGFEMGAGNCRVFVGATEVTSPTCTSVTSISFTAPPLPAGTKDVTVVMKGSGKAATLQSGLSYLNGDAPTFTCFSSAGTCVTAYTAGSNPVQQMGTNGGTAYALARARSDGVTTTGLTTVTSATLAFTAADLGSRIEGTGIPAGAVIITINSATSVEISAPATATGTAIKLSLTRDGATTIQIKGDKFITSPLPTVTFNGVAATVTAATSTLLTVKVPPTPASGVTATGCGGDGAATIVPCLPVDVKVTNADGQSVTIGKFDSTTTAGKLGFAYVKSPAVVFNACGTTTPAVSCSGTGPTTGGTAIALGNAYGFVTDSVVKLGTTAATFSGTAPSITVTSPAVSAAGAAALTVTNPDGQASTFVQAAATAGHSFSFTYTLATAPTVIGVAPSPIGSNGRSITVSTTGGGLVFGSAFSVTVDSTVVSACPTGVTVNCIQSSDISGGNTVTLLAPGHAAGTVSVKVTNADSQSSNTLASALTYTGEAAPAVTAVSPANGFTGTVLTLTGTNFAVSGTSRLPVVKFGTVEATVTAAAATSLTVTVPTLTTTGLQVITITNPDGQSTSIGGQAFRYLALPTGISLTPAFDTLNGGAQLTFTALGLDTVAAPPVIRVGANNALNVKVDSNTKATANVPVSTGAPGLADIQVVDPDGQTVTLRSAFTYTNAATASFTSVSPRIVSSNGGTLVTLKGTGFVLGAFVCVQPSGGAVTNPCTVGAKDRVATAQVVDSKTLRFVAPSHAAGPTDIVVTNPSGGAANSLLIPATENRFGYDQTPGPVLLSVSPTSGDATGGTAVTLTGANFASGSTVSFGTAAAGSVVVVSSTRITAVTPANAAGPAVVTVTSGLQSTSLTDAFTYTGTGVAPPTSTPSATPTASTSSPPGTSSTAVPTLPTGGSNPCFATLSTATLFACNKQVVTTVARKGNANEVAWTLPSVTPAPVQGVQIWRSNSPYVLVTTLTASETAFQDGVFTDTSSDAKRGTDYLVTMFFGQTAAQGFLVCAVDQPNCPNAPDTNVYAGTSNSTGFPFVALFFALIGLALFFLVVAILVAALRRRNANRPAPDAQGWNGSASTGWSQEPQTEDAGSPEEQHTLQCPACQTQFTAAGTRPLTTVCPGCNRTGILR